MDFLQQVTKQQPLQSSQAQPSLYLFAKICIFLVLTHMWIHAQMKRIIQENEASKQNILVFIHTN